MMKGMVRSGSGGKDSARIINSNRIVLHVKRSWPSNSPENFFVLQKIQEQINCPKLEAHQKTGIFWTLTAKYTLLIN